MNIAFVSSRGGHLGQIGLIFTNEVIGNNKAILVTENEKELGIKENGFNNKHRAYFLRKDYLGMNPFRYLTTLFKMINIFRRENIDTIVTNGAQISIPAVIAARLLGVRSIFIDTVIRVKTPNWSARACYFFANRFVVQHENMMKKYGRKSEYWGAVI